MLKLKLSLHPLHFFFAALAFIIAASIALENNYSTPIVGYTDELSAVICTIAIIVLAITSGITGTDLLMALLLFVLTALTFLGNLTSGVHQETFPILIDAICLVKMFANYMVFKLIATSDKKKYLLSYLVPPAKVLILTSGICGFISLFADIGMTYGEKRYGIAPYNFIFGAGGGGSRYGYIAACCLVLLMLAKTPKKKLVVYEILTLFCMIIITKGVTIIVVVIYLVLKFMWKTSKDYHFSMGNIFFIAIFGTLASSLQINTYLRNTDSPRMLLIRYGIKTANRFFPLGSGFATYGSDMAGKNYSPLYHEYGFEKYWGMGEGENGFFLNDNYLGCILGQSGYFGLALFIAILVLIFLDINKIKNYGRDVKALTTAIYIGLVVTAIGTAIIKSSGGVFVFAMLGLACGYSDQLNNETHALEPQKKKQYYKIKVRL